MPIRSGLASQASKNAVERSATVDMSVVLAVDGVAKQSPSVAAVVFDVVAGAQELAESG